MNAIGPEELRMLAELAALYPDDPGYLRRYAEALLESGQRATAIEVLRRLHALLKAQGRTQEAQHLAAKYPEIGWMGDNARPTPNFNDLLEAHFSALWMRLHTQKAREGAVLCAPDKPCAEPWLVREGKIVLLDAARTPPVAFAYAEARDLVGVLAHTRPDLALLAVAEEESEVVRLPRRRWTQLMSDSPAIAGAVRDLAAFHEVAWALAQLAALREAPIPVRMRLAAKAEVRSASARQPVVRGEMRLDAAGVLLSGKAAYVLIRHNRARVLKTITPGEIVGLVRYPEEESGLAPADVVALTPTRWAWIPQSQWMAAMASHPKLALALMEWREETWQAIAEAAARR